MTGRFRSLDRQTLWLLPPSIEDWLPTEHLARFVADIVAKLDLSAIRARYAGRGSEAYQPEMMVALLFYGYATGVFSSRKLERATYDSVAFRFLTADQHPEHDTISDFRRRFLSELGALFEQILLIAGESGVLKVGRVSIDGSKVKANASKHSALSYAYATKLEQKIKREVAELMRLAEEADQSEIPDGMDLPEELVRREDRLRAIDEAKARIRAREQERIAAEQAEHDAKMQARREKEQRTGKKTPGKKPKRPSRKIDPKAQVNLTDEESRIMPTSGGGFDQAYNVQIGVDCDSRLIVGHGVSQRPTDKTLLIESIEQLKALPPEVGTVNEILADAGYFSKENVASCVVQGITPYISDAREPHYLGLRRFRQPPPLKPDASEVDRVRHHLRTLEGRAIYALRKSTVEPVIGIVKSVLGFRQFSLRTHRKVQGEWGLVCIAYNLKRMFKLATTATAPITSPATA
jgi:transposase